MSKCISVPISVKAMKRLDYDECISGDLIDLILNDTEYKRLWKTGIFDKINKFLSTNIDDYEDENIIGIDKLTVAKKIIENEMRSIHTDHFEVINSLLRQINYAISYKTGIFFFF